MMFKKGSTVIINAGAGRNKILCEITEINHRKNIVNYFSKNGPVIEFEPVFDCTVLQNKPGVINSFGYKRNELAGMLYRFKKAHNGYSILPCSRFIFNINKFEILLNSDNEPCIDGEEPKETTEVKAVKVFTVGDTDYFIYRFAGPEKYNGKKLWSYGIAEYLTGLSVIRWRSKGTIEDYINPMYENYYFLEEVEKQAKKAA